MSGHPLDEYVDALKVHTVGNITALQEAVAAGHKADRDLVTLGLLVNGATGIAVAVTLAVAVVFVSLPRAIASVFTDDPEVLRMAADYLVILGLSQFTMAVEIVLEGAFSGSGDTLPPMLVSVPGSLARIPLAYLLAFTLGWGINGVWWTLTITTTVKALVLAYWFSRGRWKRKEV